MADFYRSRAAKPSVCFVLAKLVTAEDVIEHFTIVALLYCTFCINGSRAVPRDFMRAVLQRIRQADNESSALRKCFASQFIFCTHMHTRKLSSVLQ